MTNFDSKCEILSQLWIEYRDHEAFEDFVEYNDIGLPLAYILSNQLAARTSQSAKYIDETWTMLLKALEVDDRDWSSLDDMLESAVQGSLDADADDEGDAEANPSGLTDVATSRETTARFCGNCGTARGPGAKFCGNCGLAVST